MGLFGKPNGWDNLSAEDQLWWKTAKRNWQGALEECIRHSYTDRIRFLRANYQLSRGDRYTTALLAVEVDAAESFKTIMEDGSGFDFSNNGSTDKARARNLFRATAKRGGSLALWRALCVEAQRTKTGRLEAAEPLQIALAARYMEGVQCCIERASDDDGHLFAAALCSAAADSAETLALVLSWAQKFTVTRPALDKALLQVVEAGQADRAELLLARGADPNCQAALPLLKAAETGNIQLVDTLVARGVRLDLHGHDILTKLKQIKSESPMVEHLAKILQPVAAKIAVQQEEGETLFPADKKTLGQIQKLPNDLTLTMLFNFQTQQQIVIAEKEKQITVAVTGFGEIDSKVIDWARKKLIDFGGAPGDEWIVKPKPAGLKS